MIEPQAGDLIFWPTIACPFSPQAAEVYNWAPSMGASGTQLNGANGAPHGAYRVRANPLVDAVTRLGRQNRSLQQGSRWDNKEARAFYVLGHYKSERTVSGDRQTSGASRPNGYSVILALSQRGLRPDVPLAQVFWMEGATRSSQRFFVAWSESCRSRRLCSFRYDTGCCEKLRKGGRHRGYFRNTALGFRRASASKRTGAGAVPSNRSMKSVGNLTDSYAATCWSRSTSLRGSAH